ncbi:transcriptional regulator [Mucilaginibacter limnophilus]|uniref:Transcriptional regulator n=1 Tax=Mucilaginibacter limnophilus TaxID=1932778 RepID=A0A3S2WYF1_9SPHI|nr:triple tyrosine motif-containing protein [Mucilaginibacter limnophilus]RVU01031.1 transcriptional regulator [Mucilaginibacter limnophilus]
MFLRLVLSVLFALAGYDVFAQAFIGQRETVNYQKKQYNAGTQNWKIRQDAQGRMYFANNEGVLVFDGAYWQLYPLPNKTIVWSIEFGADKKLYAGGQDEVGYVSPGKSGRLEFTSLKNLLPKNEQNFSDIWDIVVYANEIFFRSRFKIFKYSNNRMTIYPASSSWLSMGMYNGNLIAHDDQRGLLSYKANKWQTFIPADELPPNFYITATSSYGKNASLIATARSGVYVLEGKQLRNLQLSGFGINNREHFSAAVALSDSTFLLSTYSNGVYQLDKNGTVTENISKKDGLQNSNVRCMYLDHDNNVWLGLDNGIDFIAYNNAVKHVNPAAFKDGGGFSMVKYGNSLYFGLSNGVYQLQLPARPAADLSYAKNELKTLYEGLTWNLSVVNNHLFSGNDDAAYEIKQGKMLPVSKSAGYWIYQPLVTGIGNFIAAGNYYGVRLIEDKAGVLTDKGNIGNFKESARYLEIDADNTIWTSHPYRGVYKLSLNSPHAKIYTSANGLPSTLNNFVFKIRNQVVIATEKGIYEYDKNTDKFKPSAAYKEIFGSRALRYLKEDPAGNIWFVEGKRIGVVDHSSAKQNIIYIPELERRILSGFENVCAIDSNNIFVGGENGYYHINFARYKQNIRPLRAYIRRVKAISDTDSLLFGGYFGNVNENKKQQSATIPSLGYLWNSLHFEYSSPIFEERSNVEYSYYLEGFDKEWSAWSKKTEKDYTNLPAGNYIFKIKARNHLNNESKISKYSFTITPPWYATIWAFIIYAALIIYLLYYFYKRQEKRHILAKEKELLQQREQNEEEQRRMAYLHQLELEISEKELVKLRNEKLESEIEFKNSELASSAMNLVQKKEFLLKVKEELQRLNQSGKDMVETTEIKKILRLLSEEKKVNEEWEQFSVHFNKVHADFLNVIKERYPAINQQELKLCAYLIMNLSSKEIAQLMAISVRGVEISRYRLRKKLQIPTEVNLFEFLFEIQRECMK